ncbi:MAG: hypothetical protein IPN71_15945 [Fibrobacteres bacterium]|nr:hypothetical protein [Fibrobacterota bacterium]
MGLPRQLSSIAGIRFRLALLSVLVVSMAVAAGPATLLPRKGAAVVSVGDKDPFTDREDGRVRLSGRVLTVATGSAPRSLSFPDLALFTGSGDTISSRPDSVPRPPGLSVIPIERIDRNKDGIVDDDDEIRFWVRGTSIWKRDSASAGWVRSLHPYDTARRYYVQAAAAIASPDLANPRTGAAGRTHARVASLRWVGRPAMLLERSLSSTDPDDRQTGIGWTWIRTETPQDVALDAEGLSRFPALASDTAWATVHQAATEYPQGQNASKLDLRCNGNPAVVTHGAGRSARFRLTGLREESNSIRLAGLSKFHLAGVSLESLRDPSGDDSALFPAPGMGRIAVPVRAGRECWVLEGGVVVRKCLIEGGLMRDSVGHPDTWYAVFPADGGSRTVSIAPWREASEANAIDLSENVGPLDLVVVAPDEFLAVAQEYAFWRAKDWQVRKMKVGILRARDVWAGWSGGSMDPSAVRDALSWAKSKWGATHAILLGAGHADPRGVWPKSPRCWLPHWEDAAVSTDDFFTWFSSKDLVSGIALGRVPANNLAQAWAWLEKLKRFEDPARASFGPWRNTVALLADDQRQGIELDPIRHSEQIQAISKEIEARRPWVRLLSIHEGTYKSSASGFKPDVRRDLVAALGGEVSAFVYMGHGSPGILADESVMDVASFQRNVLNPARPWFSLLGSCSVGRNDQVGTPGLLETFVVSPGQGSYAGIAATRVTTPILNRDLFVRFWRNLLDPKRPTTLGEALVAAKRTGEVGYFQDYPNQSFYNLLGDPAVIPYPGGIQVQLDSLPGVFQPLSQLSISGGTSEIAESQLRLEHSLPMVRLADSVAVKGLDGKLSVSRVVQDIRPSPAQFSGMVVPGLAQRFEVGFLLPARLPIGDTAWAKVYAWNPRTRSDGGAISRPGRIEGMGSLIPDDRVGPKIRLRHCDSSWGEGISFGSVAKLPLPVCLEALLEDTSGVSSSLGPDEGVVFALPGIREAWHPALVIGNSLKSVSARLELDSALLPPGGKYPFRVTAGDLMGNITQADIVLEPMVRGQYAVYDLFASPNPVRDDGGVRFGFKVASEPDSTGGIDTRIEASIRIHTVTGKLVKVIHTRLTSASQPRPRADWDLRDAFGQPLANGMYPYTAMLRIPEPFGTRVQELKTRGVLVLAR